MKYKPCTVETLGHYKWPQYPAYSVRHLEIEAMLRFSHHLDFIAKPWTPAINSGARWGGAWLGPFPKSGIWAVTTHDDCILPGIRHYCGGGKDPTGIPIPLLGDQPPGQPKERTVLASFVGAPTHPLRNPVEMAGGNQGVIIRMRPWRENVPALDVDECMDLLSRSWFALCPRGYGPTSYRLYEALRLGAIPVYVSDRHWLPAMVPWMRCAIIAPTWAQAWDEIRSMSDGEIAEMRQQAEAVGRTLSIESVLDWIERDMDAHRKTDSA
jgi:hypothetical protein